MALAPSIRVAPDQLLCPSAPAEVGALVIGVVNADGSVGYIRDRLAVTRDFLDSAREQGAPEQRFRFSSPCQQCACAQWAEGKCSLPERLAALVPVSELAQTLPRCSIRAECRWFAQSGARACAICPVVSTRDEPTPISYNPAAETLTINLSEGENYE